VKPAMTPFPWDAHKNNVLNALNVSLVKSHFPNSLKSTVKFTAKKTLKSNFYTIA
jgi:hypothetical protein